MKHGVYFRDGVAEFWWFGNAMSLEEFNSQVFETARSIKKEVDAVAMGMDMAGHIHEGQKEVVKLEVIEAVMKLGLCKKCRKLVEDSVNS